MQFRATSTSAAAPKRLRKRSIGKIGTAGIALAAGAAFAAAVYTTTQTGSASAPLTYTGGVTQDDVTVEPIDLANLDTVPRTAGVHEVTDSFAITNSAVTDSAPITLTGVENTGDALLFDAIHVVIAAAEDDTVLYDGLLRDIGRGPVAMGNVRAGESKVYDVYAWLEDELTSDTEADGTANSTFELLYSFEGNGPGADDDDSLLPVETTLPGPLATAPTTVPEP